MLGVIEAEGGPAPDALAVSLSAEFLARAAVEEPRRFRTLTLVTPTGFEKGADKRRGKEGSTREIPGLHRALEVPLWRRGLYDLLVSKRSMRYFLKRTFGSDRIDEGLFQYDYQTAHQPGAEHAPYAFLSGRLFSADIRDVYERLTLPVLLAHGTRGDFSDFSEAGWTATRPNWAVRAFDTGAMVYFERLEEFLSVFEAFLADPPGVQPSSASSAESASP